MSRPLPAESLMSWWDLHTAPPSGAAPAHGAMPPLTG